MDIVSFSHELLAKAFNALAEKVSRLESNPSFKRQQTVESLRFELNKLDDLFQDFSIAYDCSDLKVQKHFAGKVAFYKDGISELDKKIDAFENPVREDLGKPDVVAIKPTQRQIIVEQTNKQLAEANDDLKDIITTLNSAKSITLEINEELRRQQEKLRECGEQIKEIYSLTKQTKRSLSYFKRAIVSDKLWMILLILIIVGIIAVIILKAIGFKGSKESFGQQALRISNHK